MDIFTGYYSSPLGWLKIQSTDHGIVSVLFTEESERTGNEHQLVSACCQQLDQYFSGERKIFDLPLSQEGTVFQKKVWDLLYQIPYGRTISYMDLAKQYGDVKAIRAIASANGKNNLTIIVPCHRVIGSNRSLTGYAGGLWRKHWLLEHEGKFGSGVQQLSCEW